MKPADRRVAELQRHAACCGQARAIARALDDASPDLDDLRIRARLLIRLLEHAERVEG